MKDTLSRREFARTTAIVGAWCLGGGSLTAGGAEGAGELHIATNVYPWLTFYQRESRDFLQDLDSGLGQIASCGISGYEPIINSPEQIGQLLPLLKKHGLEMRSFYVNSTLHTRPEADASVEQIVKIGQRARDAGVRIIVTNPNPIRWGGQENKDDGMLTVQAEALNELGGRLQELGLKLGYHFHDPELRNAAREFHHMMVGTDPKRVGLCLDAHWIYRGSGNSAVAVMDIARLYGPRVIELHLRQSVKGVWTEALGEGDIDYPALARHFLSIGIRPHLVLEQAVEQGTPRTMSAVEAHRQSVAYTRQVFAGFAD